LLAPAVAGFPQGQNSQAALAKQSSIVFSGTVSQLGAVSFAGVPQSPQTIVVRVDSVLKKPPAVSLKKGDNVTVELKDPSAFQQGTQATFYTEGWIFGSGVAVKELGHDFNPGGASAAGARTGETALGYTQEQISDQESGASQTFIGGLCPSRPLLVASPNTIRTGTKPSSRSSPSSRAAKSKGTRSSSAFQDATMWPGYTHPSSRRISRASSV
jgi:hypothetical protein